MIAVAVALLVLPLVIGIAGRRGHVTPEDFRTNVGGNGLVATVFGVIAGNVGIGTFLAIFAFSAASPVIGTAIVGAYVLGLVLCGLLAPVIRRHAERAGAVSLVDLVARTHRMTQPVWVWVPVAAMFVLRAAVQLGALGLLLGPVFGVTTAAAVVASGAIIGLYLVLGGYRAAVRTDIAQALIVLAAVGIAASGIPEMPAQAREFIDFGPYRPVILVGIALFLPFSALMAIDNWQRITVARSAATARAGFLIAAVACLGVYVTIAVTGYRSGVGGDVLAIFAQMMPEGLAWLATVMFIASIMSSIDTFIMPLVTSLGPQSTLRSLRIAVMGLMAATVACTLVMGDVLMTVISAFNSLTALMPTVLAAFVIARPAALSAVLSINAGFAVTLALGFVDINIAALAGFAVAAAAYGLGSVMGRSGRLPGATGQGKGVIR
jgi:solute:Na+ symporter, SSS family